MSRRRTRAAGQGPAVILALAAASAVLTLAAAAVAPTLVAAGDAATVAELERIGADTAGFELSGQGRLELADVDRIDGHLEDELGTAAGTPSRTVQVDPVVLSHAGGEQRVRPVAATGLDQVAELVDGAFDGGLVVPDVLAEELGIEVGDVVTLRRGDRATDLRVTGIASPLDPERVPAGLRPLAEAHAEAPADARPLDLVLTSTSAALGLAADLTATSSVSWQHAAPPVGSLADARGARARMASVARAAEDPRTELGAAVQTAVGTWPSTSVGLGAVVREADAAVAALAGPARAVGIAGQAVALAVVAAAALFAARARAVALRLAAVRGRSPARQGVDALGRAAAPMVVGAAAGVGTALLLVAVLAPGPGVPTGAVDAALRDSALALLVAGAVVAVVTAVAVARAVRVGRRRRWRQVRRWPWEAAVVALAAVAYLQLRAGHGIAAGADTTGLHPLVLAFPVLLLLGSIGLAVRVARRVLPALRRVGTAASAGRFLAIRRLAAASGPGLVLAGASALALGLVVYTASVAASLDRAVDEKAALTLGADAVTSTPTLDDDGVAAVGTVVLRGRGRLAPSDVGVDVLLVDPATFAGATGTAGASVDLDGLLPSLAGSGDRLPVIVAGGPVPASTVLDVPGFRVPVDVVEEVAAFPGLGTTRPLIVANRDRAATLAPLEAAGASGTPAGRWWPERWASGADAADRLVDAGADPAQVRTAAAAGARPRLVAVTWALGALQAFAVLATVLAFAGLLLFVASRQRSTQVSYALARRMGLTPSAHRSALGTEVVVLLALAFVVATVLGLLAAALVAGALDPVPDLPPSPRATIPATALTALAGALLLAGVAGAAALQRGADRADVAEVLRGG